MSPKMLTKEQLEKVFNFYFVLYLKILYSKLNVVSAGRILHTFSFRIDLGGEQFLNTLKKGDFFGERALEDSQGKRTANIIANPGEDGGRDNTILSNENI